MHDFEHVDGDTPFKNQHLPQYKDCAEKVMKWFFEYLPLNEDGPNELSEPYFAEIARQALEASQTSKRVVLTHATFRQFQRDFVLKQLKEGCKGTNTTITVLNLSIDEDVKLRYLYPRSKHLYEANGGTLGGHMRAAYGWDGGDDMTCDEYVNFVKHNQDKFFYMNASLFQEFQYGKTVDVSSRNMDTLKAIEKALGLETGNRRNEMMSYEKIVDTVKAVDKKRDEEFSKNVDLTVFEQPANKEDEKRSSKKEEAEQSLSRRRSSLIQASC